MTPGQMRALADGRDEVAVTWSEYTNMAAKFREDAAALRAAADEVDRLHGELENAPHDSLCNQPEFPCRCWKADAL